MNKVLFLYNNVDKPQLAIKYINDGVASNLGFLSFDKSNINDNLPIFDEIVVALDQFLSRKNIDRNDAIFVINARESSKLTTVLPNVSDRKVKKMYETELASKLPNISDYDCLSITSDAGSNKVFYEYLVDSKYRKFFEELGKGLSFKNVDVDYMNSYLYSEVTANIKEKSFVYIYDENKIAYMLVVVDGELCGYSSFENTECNYRLNVASIIDKHIYELEKANIKTIYANKDILCLEPLNVVSNKYILGGSF